MWANSYVSTLCITASHTQSMLKEFEVVNYIWCTKLSFCVFFSSLLVGFLTNGNTCMLQFPCKWKNLLVGRSLHVLAQNQSKHCKSWWTVTLCSQGVQALFFFHSFGKSWFHQFMSLSLIFSHILCNVTHSPAHRLGLKEASSSYLHWMTIFY